MEPEPLQQPHKSHTLHSIVIALGAADKGMPPQTLGRAIHAQILHWLQLGNPELATTVHNSQESSFSVSGLIGNRRDNGNQSGDDFYFRIGLLDSNLLLPLLNGLEKWGIKPVYLGKFSLTIRAIYSLPGTHSWAGYANYEILANPPQVCNEITLNFISPTSFKQKQTIQPFPLPELVFGSLQRRWNVFAPKSLQFPAIEWNGLVAAFDLKTLALKMEGGAEIGAKGWVRYRFKDGDRARIATILSHFAFFSGVGRKTSMGMGQTKLLTECSE